MKLSLGWESLCAFVPEAGELNVRKREKEMVIVALLYICIL